MVDKTAEEFQQEILKNIKLKIRLLIFIISRMCTTISNLTVKHHFLSA